MRPCEGGGHGADCSDSPRRCEWRPAPCVCVTKGKRGGLRRSRGHGTLQSVETIFLGGCVSRLACVRALVNPMASDMLKKILLLKVVRDDCDDQIACSHLRVRAVRLCAVSEQRAEWSEPIKCVQFNQGNPLKTKDVDRSNTAPELPGCARMPARSIAAWRWCRHRAGGPARPARRTATAPAVG